MGEKTGISWCTATWNIVAGCTEASPGCRHCWARRDTWRMAHNPVLSKSGIYEGLVEKGQDGLRWTGAVSMIDGRLEQPFHWRKSQRIFVASQSDLFHEKVGSGFIWEAFRVMLACMHHTYLVLTKRPERMLTEVQATLKAIKRDTLPDHIWMGVTAENQEQADRRIPILLQTPAAVRWVSIEPMLGPVDLRKVPNPDGYLRATGRTGVIPDPLEGDDYVWATKHFLGLNWVVVGGESGGPPERALVRRNHNLLYPVSDRWIAKPEALEWVRSIKDQCQAAEVAFFLKGWGGPRPTSGGHLLDGREWREFPQKGA